MGIEFIKDSFPFVIFCIFTKHMNKIVLKDLKENESYFTPQMSYMYPTSADLLHDQNYWRGLSETKH